VITSNSNTEIVYQKLNTKKKRNYLDNKNIVITENKSQKRQKFKQSVDDNNLIYFDEESKRSSAYSVEKCNLSQNGYNEI
jgi:hypothetical protein